MKLIQLLLIGERGAVGPGLGPGLDLNQLARSLSQPGVHCEVLSAGLDPEPSFHSGRQQYYSTDLLARMQKHLVPGCWRLLGVTPFDLYIPILTFVFGEAQVNGSCAVVSTYRLRQEFYGLPTDPELLRQRLLKEAVHELGHTSGLTHCEDYQCVMAPSHAVEWIDLKGSSLCDECRARTTADGIVDC
jgi:archaemetzincin